MSCINLQVYYGIFSFRTVGVVCNLDCRCSCLLTTIATVLMIMMMMMMLLMKKMLTISMITIMAASIKPYDENHDNDGIILTCSTMFTLQ